VEVGGAEDGFRPLELMAVSLAGCTAMDVISILKKKQQKVTAFEVKVQASQAPDFPKVLRIALSPTRSQVTTWMSRPYGVRSNYRQRILPGSGHA